jgi:hypothetical protein
MSQTDPDEAKEDEPINYMDIKEFRELGFLQEVNRLFFHPLGLALEVVVEEDGDEHLGGIWDYRDDPEGIIFLGGAIDESKAVRVIEERARHAPARMKMFGQVIQPGDLGDRAESSP